MSAASGLTLPATVARMRGRPGSSLLLIAEAALRLALVELAGALVLAVALRAQGATHGDLPATWLWVLVRAGLGPDLAAGSVVTGLGAARSGAVLRAGMAAAAAAAGGLLLAGLVAAGLRVFAAGGFLKLPTDVVVLAGFWPAAAANAVAGAPALGLLLGLFGPALFLT